MPGKERRSAVAILLRVSVYGIGCLLAYIRHTRMNCAFPQIDLLYLLTTEHNYVNGDKKCQVLEQDSVRGNTSRYFNNNIVALP